MSVLKQTNKQNPTLSSPLLNSTAEQNIPLATVLAVVSLTQYHAHPQPTCCRGQRRPWCCASTAQKQLKHRSVISTVLATDLQHSNILAAVRKISSIPASPSTEFKSKSLPSVVTFISPYICHLQCLFRKIKTPKKFVKQVTCLSTKQLYFSPFFPCL